MKKSEFLKKIEELNLPDETEIIVMGMPDDNCSYPIESIESWNIGANTAIVIKIKMEPRICK